MSEPVQRSSDQSACSPRKAYLEYAAMVHAWIGFLAAWRKAGFEARKRFRDTYGAGFRI